MWILISHRELGAPVPWKIRVRFAPGPGDPDPVYPDPAPAPPAQPKKRRKSRARGDPWTKPKPKRPRHNQEQPPPDPNTTLGPHEEFQFSYGGYLLQQDDPSFSHVDRELRELVVRCMMELPRDRPELTELEDIFKAKLHPRPPPGGHHGGGSAPPPGGPPPGGPPPDDDDDDDSGGGPPPSAPPATARPLFAFAQHVFRDPPAPVPHAADELKSVRIYSLQSHWLLTLNILLIVTMLTMFCTVVEPHSDKAWKAHKK